MKSILPIAGSALMLLGHMELKVGEATVASRASNRVLPTRNCHQNIASKECQHSFAVVLTTSKEVSEAPLPPYQALVRLVG